MPKHEPEIHTLGHIMRHLATDDAWYHVVGMDLPAFENAIKDGAESEADRLEDIYYNRHKNDKYRVTWPDHVTVKRFNSDATYHPV
jgi:hypothetical protein